MKELYYGLYKHQTTEQLLYTLIACSLTYRYATIKNRRIKIERGAFNRDIRRILFNIEIGRPNIIDNDDAWSLREYFNCILIKKNYLRHVPIIGFYQTAKFKNEMKSLIACMNPNIINYIETNNVSHLGKINSEICNIKFEI